MELCNKLNFCLYLFFGYFLFNNAILGEYFILACFTLAWKKLPEQSQTVPENGNMLLKRLTLELLL